MSRYEGKDFPKHCSPCFLVAKPGSSAKRLVVHYAKLNERVKRHSGSIPNLERAIERAARTKYKTKLDKRSGFWQIDLTERAKELSAAIAPNGQVFGWNVMPFGLANVRLGQFLDISLCIKSLISSLYSPFFRSQNPFDRGE